MKYDDYEDLRQGLMNLPTTWYPALIGDMVRVAYKKRVFLKGKASEYVRNACEADMICIHDMQQTFSIVQAFKCDRCGLLIESDLSKKGI